MTVKAIWAQARDASGRAVIGLDGTMPWHVPEDLARFQRLTLGHAVIMGRRTWESLPPRFRPLPGRVNIVVTSLTALDGAFVAPSLDAALALADELEQAGELQEGATRWIVGGERLFERAVSCAEPLGVTGIEITEIDLTTPGDAYAPTLGPCWAAGEASELAESAGGLSYRFVNYTRR